MFFFRAVIHLLIRSKIYQYIAYQRMAGNQLKKFLPVQRYFSPWKWKYNLHTTEFVFPITVKVTEPLRFFFCRFLLESAAGLFLVCVAAPRLSIWIFTFQKFRLEVLAVKYAPRKVYIKESGGYVELSYTDFCRRRQADKGYMDKLFIPVQGCLLALFFRQSTDCFKKQLWRDFLPGFLKDGFGGFTFEIFIKRMKLSRFV